MRRKLHVDINDNNIENKDKKGFTLVELLAVIVIVTLVIGIASYSVISIINNSKNKSIVMTENNIKKTASDYVKENEDMVWVDDPSGANNKEISCVSVKSMVNEGYFKEKDLDREYLNKYVIVTKDKVSKTIISEKFDEANQAVCSTSFNVVKDDQICAKNLVYDGKEQNLISAASNVYTTSGNNMQRDAGSYNIKVKPQSDYNWENGRNNEKNISCSIDKAKITVTLNPYTNTYNTDDKKYSTTVTRVAEGDLKPSGTVTAVSSNIEYVTVDNKNNNSLIIGENSGDGVVVNMVANAARGNTTTVTITFTPDDTKNYKKGSAKYSLNDSNTLNYYNVNLNPNGGVLEKTSFTMFKGLKYENLDNYIPNRVGYTFEGWFTALSGGTKITKDSTFDKSYDITLYAHWKANTYTVNLNANGGTVSPTNITVTYDKTYEQLPTPTKKGANFDGWFTELNGGTKIDNSTKVTITNDQTLYAHWTNKTYTVSFDNNCGTANPSSKVVTYSEKYGNLPNPNKTGYTFNGWYTSSTNGILINSNSIVNTDSNHNLYSRCSANSYTVTFNANGGNVTPNSKSVTYDSTYSTLPTPTKTGASFDGWYTDINGGTKITSSTKVTITSNQTLYAHWTNKSYIVALDNQGATTSGTTSVTATYGSAMPNITIPQKKYTINYNANGGSVTTSSANTNATYTFGGYYTSTNGSGTQYYTSSGTSARSWDIDKSGTTLYAKWTGGTVTLPTPTKSGYTFDGWYKESSLTNKVSNSTIYTSNQTLYAKWTSSSYTVALDNQGATTNGTTSVTATYGSAMPNITIPQKKYTINYNANGGSVSSASVVATFTFGGYYTGTSGSGTQYYTSSGGSARNWDKTSGGTLYAKWTGGAVTLPTPTRSGYTFDGWYDAQSGGNKKGNAGSSYTPSANNITLYAHWTQEAAKTYTVTFNPNGGSVTPTSKTVTNGSTYGNLPTPTRSNYTFNGWYTSATGGTQILSSSTVNLSDNQTLYAHWTQEAVKTYTVNYDCNLGIVSGSNNTTYSESSAFERGKSYNLTANKCARSYTVTFDRNYSGNTITYEPKTANYEFIGWNTSEDGDGTVYSDKASVKDLTEDDSITLYAQWKPVGITAGLTNSDTEDSLCRPTRKNYIFSGWFYDTNGTDIAFSTDELCDNTFYIVPDSDMTLYAGWIETAKQFTISYYSGASKSNGISHSYGTSFSINEYGTNNDYYYVYLKNKSYYGGVVNSLSENEYKRSGYDFSGWGERVNGSCSGVKAKFNDKDDIIYTPANANDNYQLCARWNDDNPPLISWNDSSFSSPKSTESLTYYKNRTIKFYYKDSGAGISKVQSKVVVQKPDGSLYKCNSGNWKTMKDLVNSPNTSSDVCTSDTDKKYMSSSKRYWRAYRVMDKNNNYSRIICSYHYSTGTIYKNRSSSPETSCSIGVKNSDTGKITSHKVTFNP